MALEFYFNVNPDLIQIDSCSFENNETSIAGSFTMENCQINGGGIGLTGGVGTGNYCKAFFKYL